jgi:hypothetical protein
MYGKFYPSTLKSTGYGNQRGFDRLIEEFEMKALLTDAGGSTAPYKMISFVNDAMSKIDELKIYQCFKIDVPANYFPDRKVIIKLVKTVV